MSKTKIKLKIHAPLDFVFRLVSDVKHFSRAVDDISKIEYLSKQQKGKGTIFRETRNMNGESVENVLEITEFVPNKKVRFVSESQGTTWDSVYIAVDKGKYTLLILVMRAKTQKLSAKLQNLLIKPIIKKAIKKDLDAVKEYCEKKN